MDNRPHWVPEWIWQRYLAINSTDPVGSRARMRATIIADPGCAVVWKAMTRRRGRAWATNPIKALIPRVPEGYEANVVLLRAPVLASGLSPEDCIPASKRFREGKRMAKLASGLRADLLSICIAPHSWPYPFGGDLADNSGRRHLTDASDQRPPPPGWAKIAFVDPNLALKDLCDMLEAVERAANAWSSWKSVVTQANAPEAIRLSFIRNMSKLFRSIYGSPLRECVAALTRCLFKCEMDAATVAKLAP